MATVITLQAPDTPSNPTLWPRPANAWYAVFMLAIVLMLSQLDRGVITLLVQPIKRDLGLTDTEMSLLIGLAFISFYSLLGVPLARLSDRKTRRTMIALGVGFWSLATVGCGLAQNFWQMFMCRAGLGAGEAVNGPATYSLLSDYFPPAKLPRAIAVLTLGFTFGAGLSLIMGSFVIEMLPSVPDFHVPLIGTVRNWQLVFFAVGVPGILVALLMLTVMEPGRQGRLPSATASIPFFDVLKFMAANYRVYAPIFLSLAVGSLSSAGAQGWLPTFYQRTYGWSPQHAGTLIGAVSLLVGPVGLFCGTRLVEHHLRRGRDDANMRVVALGYTLAIPFAIAGPLMPTPWLALASSGLATLCGFIGAPTMTAAVQTITPNQMRGQINAMYLLMLSAIGMGIGPFFIALITDHVFGAESMLRYSMSLAALLLAPAAAIIAWSGVKPYGAAVALLRHAV